MLRQKKLLVSFLLVIFVLAMVLIGCDSLKPKSEDGTKNVTIVIGQEEYNVSTSKEYIHDLLVDLKDKSTIQYEYTTSPNWVTVMKLNALETAVSWNPFITIYHSIDDVALIDYTIQKYSYKDAYYYSSSVSVVALPVKNGATYIFVEAYFN